MGIYALSFICKDISSMKCLTLVSIGALIFSERHSRYSIMYCFTKRDQECVPHMFRQGLDTKISLNRTISTARHFTTVSMSSLVLYVLIITVANDVANYEIIWEFSQDQPFREVFSQRRVELGSLFILWSFANYFSAITMVFLTGFIALFAKYYLFNKYIDHFSILSLT